MFLTVQLSADKAAASRDGAYFVWIQAKALDVVVVAEVGCWFWEDDLHGVEFTSRSKKLPWPDVVLVVVASGMMCVCVCVFWRGIIQSMHIVADS